MRILLTGGTGQLGRELGRELAALGEVIAPARADLDLAQPASIRAALQAASPDIIVNAGAFAAMDPAEANPALAMQVNGTAPGVIGAEALRLGALLVHFSSAYLFDGTANRPYGEDDAPNPINAYGRSKLAGERAILASGARHLVLRLSWVHSLSGSNFLTAILDRARERAELPVVDDQIGSPTWARTVAAVTARVLAQHGPAEVPGGVFHLSAAGAVSRSGFAEHAIAAARRARPAAGPWAHVRPISSNEYRLPAPRPRYCVLDNARFEATFGVAMPHWQSEVERCVAELGRAGSIP